MRAMFFITHLFAEVISQLRERQLQSILEDLELDMQFIPITPRAQTTVLSLII